MTRRIILFAGPSLPAGTCLPPSIELRPPARCGDLLAAAPARPQAIALVDGRFEDAPAVWHKEIAWALACGVAVFGAASLGALRAAELEALGMIGVGRIYADYRDGTIERDDAVMVLTAPPELGHRALTLALVDAEASIAAAGLAEDVRARLLAIARACNFRTRTWPFIISAYAERVGTVSARAAADAIARAAFSQKERDAAELIALLDAGPIVPPPPVRMPHTIFLRRLLAQVQADARQAATAIPA